MSVITHKREVKAHTEESSTETCKAIFPVVLHCILEHKICCLAKQNIFKRKDKRYFLFNVRLPVNSSMP